MQCNECGVVKADWQFTAELAGLPAVGFRLCLSCKHDFAVSWRKQHPASVTDKRSRAFSEYLSDKGFYPSPEVSKSRTHTGIPWQIICDVCGAQFKAKRSDAKFCSSKCRQRSRRKQ